MAIIASALSIPLLGRSGAGIQGSPFRLNTTLLLFTATLGGLPIAVLLTWLAPSSVYQSVWWGQMYFGRPYCLPDLQLSGNAINNSHWQKCFHIHALSLSPSQCPLFCVASAFALPRKAVHINKRSPRHHQGPCSRVGAECVMGRLQSTESCDVDRGSASGKLNKLQSILTGKSKVKLILMRTCHWAAGEAWKGCTR